MAAKFTKIYAIHKIIETALCQIANACTTNPAGGTCLQTTTKELLFFIYTMPCGAVLLLPNCKLASIAMARRVTLVDTSNVAATSQQPTTTDWELCVVCQEVKGEPLTSPSLSKWQDVGRGYKTLAENLIIQV